MRVQNKQTNKQTNKQQKEKENLQKMSLKNYNLQQL